MTGFNHTLVELSGITPAQLTDTHGLSSVVVAAAGAIGIASDIPPVVSEGHQGTVVGFMSRDGHIVLHTTTTVGRCLVDIIARAPVPVTKGADVIALRLGAKQRTPIDR